MFGYNYYRRYYFEQESKREAQEKARQRQREADLDYFQTLNDLKFSELRYYRGDHLKNLRTGTDLFEAYKNRKNCPFCNRNDFDGLL